MPTRMIICALIAVLAMLPTPPQVWAATPPTLTLTANPTEVTPGEVTTLTWRSTRMRRCDSSWAGRRPTSGEDTRTVQDTTSFVLTCTGSKGTLTRSVTVMVTDTPPSPPPRPSVLTLTWTDNAATEDGFLVERLTNGTWTVIATLSLDTETYQDGPLTAGTTYCYRVAAFNLAGPSGYSNEACTVAP
jgi:hypothetical protein